MPRSVVRYAARNAASASTSRSSRTASRAVIAFWREAISAISCSDTGPCRPQAQRSNRAAALLTERAATRGLRVRRTSKMVSRTENGTLAHNC